MDVGSRFRKERHTACVVSLVCLVGLATILTACGDDTDGSASAGAASNEPLVQDDLRVFELREIDGDAYEGSVDPQTQFTADVQLRIRPYLPGVQSQPAGLVMSTPCGFWSTDTEIDAGDIAPSEGRSHIHERSCDADEFAAVSQVVTVLSSGATYTFDGSALRLQADGSSVGFDLHLPDADAVTEQHRLRELADAVAAGRDAQAAVLQQGVPTFEQYREAMQTTVDCARAAGQDVTDLVETPGPRLGYGIRDGSTVEFDRCYEQHVVHLDVVYQISLER